MPILFTLFALGLLASIARAMNRRHCAACYRGFALFRGTRCYRCWRTR